MAKIRDSATWPVAHAADFCLSEVKINGQAPRSKAKAPKMDDESWSVSVAIFCYHIMTPIIPIINLLTKSPLALNPKPYM